MKTKEEIIKEATGYTSNQIKVSQKYGQPFYSFNELGECMEAYCNQFTLSREELIGKIYKVLATDIKGVVNREFSRVKNERLSRLIADALMGYVTDKTREPKV